MRVVLQNRRQFLASILALAGSDLLVGCGQQAFSGLPPSRVPRVGILGPQQSLPAIEHEAFRQTLRESGYVEGDTIQIDYRLAAGKTELLPGFAAALVASNADLILTLGTIASLESKKATSTIPIIFFGGGDPVALGLVPSLGQPGGNVTGVTTFSTTINGKRMELLMAAVPSISRMAFLIDETSLVKASVIAETQAAGQRLGVQILPVEARDAAGIEAAIRGADTAGADALLIQPSPLLTEQCALIAQLALQHRLATLGDVRDYPAAGGLLSYGVDFVDVYRRLAGLVIRILKGTKPSELPVEQPTVFQFVVNVKTAQALGLTLPQSVLQLATDVIQ